MEWKGMHNGIVTGKWFEKTRRSRKGHSARRAEIAGKATTPQRISKGYEKP